MKKNNSISLQNHRVLICYFKTDILDLNTSETSIDLTDYLSGFYTIALVCNGQIVDAKTLFKN